MIQFAKPYFKPEWRQRFLELAGEILDSGQLTQGVNVKSLEEYFSRLLGSRNVAATNSCTASLHLAMLLIGISKGDEVVVPSNTFAATANAVVYCGGTPVFAEIDPMTLNIDPNHVAELITEKTKAIIPVHLGGVPCVMSKISNMAEERGIHIVEDCAHAHGAYYHGRPCGTFGDIACFSFYPTKVIAGPEGGLLVTADKDADTRGRILLNQGRGGFGPLEISEIGYNYRMNEFQAAVIRVQMESLDEIVDKRTEIVQRYRRNLSRSRLVSVPKTPADTRPSYYSFTVQINGADRDVVRDKMTEEGIGTSIMYHPVHLQPIYQRLFGYKPGSLPKTEEVCSKIISLPLHLGLTMAEVDLVCEKLISTIEDASKGKP